MTRFLFRIVSHQRIHMALLACVFVISIPSLSASLQDNEAVAKSEFVFAGNVLVGDHGLYVDCQGSGPLRVMLLGGYGGGVRDWELVQPEIARDVRVCSYDRAGVGMSDPAQHRPTAAADNANDLHLLLTMMEIDEPVILVGFSVGGLLARYYAAAFPDEVAAVVLIDPTPPLWPAVVVSWSEGKTRSQLLESFSGFNVSDPEQLDVFRLGMDVFTSSYPSAPVYMLTSQIKTVNPASYGDRVDRVLRELQEDQAKELDALHVRADHCPHYLTAQCPASVVSVIQQAMWRTDCGLVVTH